MTEPGAIAVVASKWRDRRVALTTRAGRSYSTLLAVAVTAVVVVAFPVLDGGAYPLRVATTAGITAVLALGLTILVGGSGEMSLAHGSLYGVGAYATGYLMVHTWAFVPALFVGVAIAAAVAGLAGLPLLRTHGLSFAIVTLGLAVIASDAFEGWTGVTGGPLGIVGIPNVDASFLPVLGAKAVGAAIRNYYVVWIAVIATLAFVMRLFRTDFGTVVRAVKGDAELAESLGFRAAHYRLTAFVLSAAVAAIAGGLYAEYVGYVAPDPFTFWASFSVLIIVVIGGLERPIGTMVAAVALTAAPEVLRFLQTYDQLVYAALLFVVLLVRRKTRSQ
jgi:branched-chain amino acid transport system permease protein